jgi:hypothetical protein
MDSQKLTELVETILRARLYDDTGAPVALTCPACGETVANVRRHSASCWQLRSQVSAASETSADAPAAGDDTAEMDERRS